MTTNACVQTNRRSTRHGLLAPVDDMPLSALTMGLLTGCGIAVAMIAPMAITDLAAGTRLADASSCLGCVAAGLGTGLVQQVLFNPRVLGPGLTYPVRTTLFGLCDLAVLTGSAWLGGWVPRDMPGAWITFVGIYLAILFVLTVALSMVYRRQEARYAERLAAYRRRRSRE